LEPGGSIVTTPFSYVATTNAIIWEGFQPVFADIDEKSCCISPQEIKRVIRADTKAILPVHVYGNACQTEEIGEIGREFGIPIIYDAAHAFGSTLHGKALCSFGEVSALSFHATKLFHTVEGGALVTNNDALFEKLNWMHTFGHQMDHYYGLGTNGKMSEFHAAMGLCNLPRVPEFIAQRKKRCMWYDARLFPSRYLRKPEHHAGLSYNGAYYPVIFDTAELCSEAMKRLNERHIFPRRYFWPSLNLLPHVTPQSCPVSESISRRVLCLPLSVSLEEDDIATICDVLNSLEL
jgi:dTDP-4-amino-4,6-dideoxygalactose transaminase